MALPCDTLQKWRRYMIEVEAELPPITQPCVLVTGEKSEGFFPLSHLCTPQYMQHRNTVLYLCQPGWFLGIFQALAKAFSLPEPHLELLHPPGRARVSLNTLCILEHSFIRCHSSLVSHSVTFLSRLGASIDLHLSPIHLSVCPQSLEQKSAQRQSTRTSKAFYPFKNQTK